MGNHKASDIIRNLLIKNGGTIKVENYQEKTYHNGSIYEINLSSDTQRIETKALPQHDYELTVFDIIVNLLIECSGTARKGAGRNNKLNEENCGYDTIVGRIGRDYFNKQAGESVWDPVMVLGAVLDWADICSSKRGYLELTPNYREILKS